MNRAAREQEIAKLEREMKEASKMLEFEYAAVLRDRIKALRAELQQEKLGAASLPAVGLTRTRS